jgi:transcriptional regulator with XRE-family HTH domain
MQYDKPIPKIRGQYIKDHRKRLDLTQAQLCERVGVDERTVGMWERGEVTFIRRSNLEQLVDVLRIPPDLLGLPESWTSEGTEEMERQARIFLEDGAYVSVQGICESLLEHFTKLAGNGRAERQQALIPHVRIRYMMGMTVATLTNNPKQALRQFMLMEQYALDFENTDPIALALAHMGQADMYRRLAKFDEAQNLLESVEGQLGDAWHSRTGIDVAVLGNCYQFLTRVYLAKGEIIKSLEALKKAEDLASQVSGLESPWYICFCRCSAAEEAAKTYMLLRQYQKSLEYITQAKRLSQSTAPRWEIPITLTEGECYIRASHDVEPLRAKVAYNEPAYYEMGVKALLRGYELAKDHNHLRQMQRVQRLTTKWERKGGLSLELAQTLREEMEKIDRVKGGT